jgi:hypothetical protein
MTNEPILLPVAPHSEGCEFPLFDEYRGIVEEAMFDRLGRPSFFDEAVEVVMGRIAARIEGKNPEATGNSKSTSCAFAPQESWIREVASCEARRMKREIEERFVKGRLGLARD